MLPLAQAQALPRIEWAESGTAFWFIGQVERSSEDCGLSGSMQAMGRGSVTLGGPGARPTAAGHMLSVGKLLGGGQVGRFVR